MSNKFKAGNTVKANNAFARNRIARRGLNPKALVVAAVTGDHVVFKLHDGNMDTWHYDHFQLVQESPSPSVSNGKVGDRVRVIDTVSQYGTQKGDEGVLLSSGSGVFAAVKMTTGKFAGRERTIPVRRLEIVRPATTLLQCVYKNGELGPTYRFDSADAARKHVEENGDQQNTYELYDLVPRGVLRVSERTVREIVES